LSFQFIAATKVPPKVSTIGFEPSYHLTTSSTVTLVLSPKVFVQSSKLCGFSSVLCCYFGDWFFHQS